MGKTILITSGKGGVGKTTATANLGTALALRGRGVVLVEVNPGLRSLDMVLGLEGRITSDLAQVLEGTCPLEGAMTRDERPGRLYLIAAPEGLDEKDIEPEKMKGLCQSLKERFDYVIIDSPNGVDRWFKAALAPAEQALIVATPEVSSILNADRVIGLIRAVGLPKPGLILNRIRYDMVRRGEMLAIADVLELLDVQLMGMVPEHDDIVRAANLGVPSVYRSNSPPGRAFRDVASRLEGEEVPFGRRRYPVAPLRHLLLEGQGERGSSHQKTGPIKRRLKTAQHPGKLEREKTPGPGRLQEQGRRRQLWRARRL